MSSISEFVQRVLEAMVRLGIIVVALFILIAGYMYVSARGNAQKLGEAHENFKYVIYGAVLILGAWVIATVIGGTITQILGQ
ncbi:pilin [Hyphomicrobium denitrificans]|uniref:pilin n=1 Tax=Hyphomicrobium denitrificans TaxID=53399 RepID=UPI0003128404|nr:pilin [Hyphomicrobium denitrificans]